MIHRFRSVALSCALVLLVAACNKAADEGATGTVSGEVLPGSISDAMINLDTSTASPPMAAIAAPERKSAAPSSSDAPPVAEPAAESADDTPAESAEAE